MKKKTYHFIFSIIIVLLILFTLGISGFISSKGSTSIDLNSGDIRVKKYAFSFKVKDRIFETYFSEEVRRLDIDIPKERVWKSVSSHSKIFMGLLGGEYRDGKYGKVYNDLNSYVIDLEINDISDSNRVAAMKEALYCLRNEKPGWINKKLDDTINKYKNKEGN